MDECLDADFSDPVTVAIAACGFDIDKGKYREFGVWGFHLEAIKLNKVWRQHWRTGDCSHKAQ